MSEDQRALGRIEGKLDMLIDRQADTNARLDKVDERLRTVERKSAVIASTAGGLVSIGMALIIEKGKRVIGL